MSRRITHAFPKVATRWFRHEQGYSLVEMLIAVAITGVVVLAVLTLFTLGRSNVYAGRQMTHAVSVGTRMMEDLSAIPLQEVYTSFNIPDNATLSTVTVAPATATDSSYDGSIVRSTSSVSTAGTCPDGITFNNDPSLYLRRWYCQMQTSGNKLPQGSISLVFTPRKPLDAAAPLSVQNASVVRVRAIIRWTEGLRRRQLILDTNKFNRPNPE